MPTFRIQHNTKYEYDRLIQESMNEIKIFPVLFAEQEVLQHDLTITSNPDVQVFYDYWEIKPAHLTCCLHIRNLILTAG